MGGERKPPQSAEELLERYAAGERNFYAASLAGVDLSGRDLRNARFEAANLEGANLRGANLYGANLMRARLRRADLVRSDASLANFEEAQLFGSDFSSANLEGATFRGANATAAVLRGSRLVNAVFEDASLKEVDLKSATLERANLRGASCDNANFFKTSVRGIRLAYTTLVGVDLSCFCGALPYVEFGGPCYVDHAAVALSIKEPSIKEFLQRAGMPEVFVEYMVSCALSVQTDAFELLRSTYLIYGQPDEPFARKLYEALHRNGVVTFFFPEHSVPGKRLHRAMHEGIAGHDRMVLICSKDSLDREGVLYELDQTLARETREKKSEYLLPLLLDDYVFGGWRPPNLMHLHAVRERIAADFRGGDQDDDKFNAGLLKLIAALRR